MPLKGISFDVAKKSASAIEDSEAVKSHLTFGAEYDSVLEWFIETKVRTFAEIAEDSTNWGNYYNAEDSPKQIVETGSREKWCTNNIYDFAGNVDEWTQEEGKSPEHVIRGGYYFHCGRFTPVASRENIIYFYDTTGFRVALCIK